MIGGSIYFSRIDRVLDHCNVPRSEYDSIHCAIKKNYLDKNNWKIFNDTIETLKKAKANGYQNLLIANHAPELKQLIHDLQLDSYFVDVISSGIVGYEKPHAKIFQIVQNYISPGSYVCKIGDSYTSDILGAQEYGIDAILVRKKIFIIM